MKIAVPNESGSGERRVALVPDVIKRLSGKGHEVVVESGAGEGARIPDALFEEAGAKIGSLEGADVVVRVTVPSAEDVERLPNGSVLIGFLAPLTSPETARALASAGVTAFAMEAIPRISRAQSMDALSSQASVGGYRAALIGAQELGRFYPMLTTAAGTIPPAKVLVLGAGVAGLQAIATAKRLGAQVTAFDVRSVVKEQVQSLGAKFLELDIGADAEAAGGYARELTPEEQQRQQEALNEALSGFDVVITTAQIPGRPAPKLVTEAGVRNMRPGCVIVDLAGEGGGNCELTQPGETVIEHDVAIVAPLNLPSTMPEHASQLYARNVMSLLELITGEEGQLELNFEDEVVSGACITREGEIVHEGARKAAGQTQEQGAS
ncbi:MAG TPA: Re/Si-specific NAD(P)(+) transhydrogenase subunit alpha [Thermoleophilaceae bacterium]|nr:Re/Si-specific NAD(P)(+) transhydrogenase subunit alpha [Thermoleophilaceae bacterium]